MTPEVLFLSPFLFSFNNTVPSSQMEPTALACSSACSVFAKCLVSRVSLSCCRRNQTPASDHIPIVEALFLPDNKDRSTSFSDLFDDFQVGSGLELSIGGVEVLYPASVMRPRGLLSLMVATDMHDNNELLLMLLKGVYHLDVNPSNIVVLVDDEKPTKAILIDFSIADSYSLRPSLPKRVSGIQYPSTMKQLALVGELLHVDTWRWNVCS
eukprot:scaffold6419_cov116-Cylindrotheca_fusiformis.AAC.4